MLSHGVSVNPNFLANDKSMIIWYNLFSLEYVTNKIVKNVKF